MSGPTRRYTCGQKQRANGSTLLLYQPENQLPAAAQLILDSAVPEEAAARDLPQGSFNDPPLRLQG